MGDVGLPHIMSVDKLETESSF